MARVSIYKATLLLGFIALQIADVLTTKRVLDHGGWEGNPVVALVMAHLGNYWFLPKLVLMTACAVWMMRWKPKSVAPFVALMGIVVANNAMWGFA